MPKGAMYREKLIFAGYHVRLPCALLSGRYIVCKHPVSGVFCFITLYCTRRGAFLMPKKKTPNISTGKYYFFKEVIFCLTYFMFFGGIIFETVKSIFTFNG